MKILDPEFNINWYQFSGGGTVTGLEKKYGLYVSPNPAREYLSLNIDSRIFDAENSLTIRNLSGQEVFTKTAMTPIDFKHIAIGELAAGLYILDLEMGSSGWKRKVIIE